MFHVFTPVTNIELYHKFLADQLKDSLADLIEDGMSVREADLYQSLTFSTQESLKSLDRQVREAAKEVFNNQSEETKGE